MHRAIKTTIFGRSVLRPYRVIFITGILMCLTACDALNQAAPTSTPILSAATLAASPTVQIRNSDELYDNVVVGQNNLTAAAMPSNGILPPEIVATQEAGGAKVVEILLEDGTRLVADLYERIEMESIQTVDFSGQQTVGFPGVLLLSSDRLSWDLLPLQLFQSGMTVMVVEIRANPSPTDIQTLLVAFGDIASVEASQIAVIGAGSGADMALQGCAFTAICDAIALLSPTGGTPLVEVMSSYNPRPVFIAAASDDNDSYPTALALTGVQGANFEFAAYSTGRGTELLIFHDDLMPMLVSWVSAQLENAG